MWTIVSIEDVSSMEDCGVCGNSLDDPWILHIRETVTGAEDMKKVCDNCGRGLRDMLHIPQTVK